jgi:alkaline phosphatase D
MRDGQKSRVEALTHGIDRRRLLILTGRTLTAAMGLALLPGDDLFAAGSLGDTPFKLGAASGDPHPTGVVIWTRLVANPLAADGLGGMPNRALPVGWQVASDPAMTQIVASGTAQASPRLAHSVHVEVGGLRPGRPYFYRFSYRGEESPVGRTITAPALAAQPKELKFAFASCQDWQAGFYNAYRHMAREDIDLVLHLGDYIYDLGIPADGGARRRSVPEALRRDATTLAEYRLRYSLAKTDPDLQEAHRRFPFVCVWDDHEVEDDYGGSALKSGRSALPRRAAAYQAYYENMPLRAFSVPRGPDMRIYRRVMFGDLVTFHMLDTRQYRSGHPCGFGEGSRCAAAYDWNTSILGDRQEAWLATNLERSASRWNVIGQQVLMAQFDHAIGRAQRFWLDAWDPYMRDRQRLLDLFRRSRAKNPVVITGDWHSTFANDLKLNFSRWTSPAVAAEFATPSLTSGGDSTPYDGYYRPMLPENPHVKYFDGDRRGYFRARLTREALQADVRFVSSVEQRASSVVTGASFVVENGAPGLSSVSAPAAPTVNVGQFGHAG